MKISLQSQDLVKEYGLKEAYEMLATAGVDAVDWNLDHAWKFSEVVASKDFCGLSIFEEPMEKILAYYKEELDVMKEKGISIAQAHAPFAAYSPVNPGVLPYAIRIYQKMIAFCAIVGCPKLVIHGISRGEDMPNVSVEELEALNMQLYEGLIPALLEAKTVKVCLENLFTKVFSLRSNDFWEGCCSDPHQAVDWIDRLNAKAGAEVFGFCLDTGHLNLLRKPFYSYIPILGKRICALHINDNSQDYDTHLMPYAGSIHWAAFLEEMRAIGYDEDLSFETFAQVRKSRLPEQLLPTFLHTVVEIGRYFRAELQK